MIHVGVSAITACECLGPRYSILCFTCHSLLFIVIIHQYWSWCSLCWIELFCTKDFTVMVTVTNSVKYSYNKKIIYKCDFPHALTYMCAGNQCENNFTDNGESWGRQDNSVVGCLSEDYEVCGSSLCNSILLQSSSLTSSCCLLILPSCY